VLVISNQGQFGFFGEQIIKLKPLQGGKEMGRKFIRTEDRLSKVLSVALNEISYRELQREIIRFSKTFNLPRLTKSSAIRMILENYFAGNLVWKEDVNEPGRGQ
jgi:hypothetical protein